MAEQKRYWMGSEPVTCQITGVPIVNQFVDGATTVGGWAIMNPSMHKLFGRGLGTGRGQLYEKQADGRWLKIEG